MKNYNKVIAIMSTSQGMRTHTTQLSKVAVVDCDEKLIHYLSKAVSALENQIAHAESAPPLRLNNAIEQRIVDLFQYCKDKTKDEKPEWMITAEKYGWAPKY